MNNINSDITPEKIELSVKDMVKGIGRKATDEELINYLSKDLGEPIKLDKAFTKYEDNSPNL